MRADEALRRSDAAIVGKLLKVVPHHAYAADYRYRVQRVYKAGRGLARGAVVSVRSALGGAACGLPEGIGRRYGLLLRGEGESSPPPPAAARWWGGSCGVLAPHELRSAARGRGARIATSCAS
jgi:hypothetical protein